MPDPGPGSALGDALRRFRPSRVLVYGDTILIQANLIEEDDDDILVGDTETLAFELIAFTDQVEDAEATVPAFAPIPQDDPMSTVLQ